jgi:hypothetical protein
MPSGNPSPVPRNLQRAPNCARAPFNGMTDPCSQSGANFIRWKGPMYVMYLSGGHHILLDSMRSWVRIRAIVYWGNTLRNFIVDIPMYVPYMVNKNILLLGI